MVVTLPPSDPVALKAFPALALSPDGRRIVIALTQGGKSQLHVRSLDDFQTRPLPGTDGAISPFLSPDAQWVAFFAEGKLKKVAARRRAAAHALRREGQRGRRVEPARDDRVLGRPAGRPLARAGERR